MGVMVYSLYHQPYLEAYTTEVGVEEFGGAFGLQTSRESERESGVNPECDCPYSKDPPSR